MDENSIDNTRLKNRIIYVIVVLIVFADQISKYAVKSMMSLYESIEIFGDFFRLTYIENPGMAFGIQFENKILFTIISIIAAGVILVYQIRLRNERFLFRISLSLILGGAIGNIFDRVIHGKVVDFFDVEFFDIAIPAFSLLSFNLPGYGLTRWPVFNIADSAVTCGMILISWIVFFKSTPTKQEITT